MANAFFTVTLLFCLLLSSSLEAKPAPATAQNRIKRYKTIRSWTVGLGYWSWTEPLELTAGGTSDSDYVNSRADVFSLGYRSTTGSWGYSADLLWLMGKASAGGNATQIPYQSQRNWNGYGAQLSGSYRRIKQVEVGLALPVIFRDPEWPTPAGVSATTGQKVLVTGLFFWRLAPWNQVLIENGIGPLGFHGQTMWKLDFKYVF